MNPPPNPNTASEVRAGFASLKERTIIRMGGQDRQSFFHNFCTNNIKALQPGQTTEAFVLNEKGKILAHVLVLCCPDELTLSGAPGQSQCLIEHLNRYVIREDVTLLDAGTERAEIFATGDEVATRLATQLDVIPESNRLCQALWGDIPLTIANVEIAGPGYLIQVESKWSEAVTTRLEQIGVTPLGDSILNRIRIENGTPWFGIDIDENNLPQELRRDETAIDFNKGCYLGQETVARIDALGHVNRWLVQLKFEDSEPIPVGVELVVDGKTVGRVTSVVSIAPRQSMALGYVKRFHAQPGNRLEVSGMNSSAEIV